jgi:hypothetical protein
MEESGTKSSFLEWWQERVKLRRFIPRTLIHEESAQEVVEAAFNAGWRAAKSDDGYHEYKPPMNTLKDYCIACYESPENTKHLRTSTLVEALRKRGWSDENINGTFTEVWEAHP